MFDRKDDRMTIDRRRDGDLAVTDRSIELRRRKREIVHIIHHTTWIMESLSFIIGLVVFPHILCPEMNPNICANLIFIHNLLHRCHIPHLHPPAPDNTVAKSKISFRFFSPPLRVSCFECCITMMHARRREGMKTAKGR